MESGESRSFFDSLNSFASSLLSRVLVLHPGKNLICSPLTIQSCLGMLRMGAVNGSVTAKELDERIGFTSRNITQIAEDFQKALSFYRECNVMHMAYKIYLDQNYKTSQEFEDVLAEKYYSELEEIDFAETEVAADAINDWVANQTNHLIKDIVSPGDLEKDTKMVLINASHFKGNWTIKFDERATKREIFYLDKWNKLKVPMMNSYHEYDYAELKAYDAKVLRMSYNDTELKMLIILPNKQTGLQNLLEALQKASLEDITKKLARKRVNLKLPKFTAEFEGELTPICKEMGVNRIFVDRAELGRILDEKKVLKVSKILHKSFIEIGEEGTEVEPLAPLEERIVRGKPRKPPPPVNFYADHPFYFAIYDAIYGPILVGSLLSPTPYGCINNPSKPCYCER